MHSQVYLLLVAPIVLMVVLTAYLRWAEACILKAHEPWDSAVERLNRFVDRDDVPDIVAAHVTAFAAIAGCGCVTTVMLRHRLLASFFSGPSSVESASDEIDQLNEELQDELCHILSDLLVFDSLHVPIRGLVLRLVLTGQFLKNSSAEPLVDEGNMAPVFSSAVEAAKEKNEHNPTRLLVAA